MNAKKNVILLICLFGLYFSAKAQISGANPAVVGTTERYYYYSSTSYSYYWENSGGTALTWGFEGWYYWVDIQWTSSGSHYLMFVADAGILAQTTITVTSCTPPTAPPTPIVSSNTCGSKTISFNGSPPSGVTWYWQGTNANGTNMSNSSSTYAASNPGTSTYYLRAYKTNCWGASVGVTVTVNAVPGTPWPVVSQSTNTCGYKTLTATPGDGPPPSGVSWHWQGRDPNGTNNNYDYTNPYYPDVTGTYYIRALSSAGCWSASSMAISVTVNDPVRPPAPVVSGATCGTKTLSFNGTPPSGSTWYWQLSATGTSTSNSSSSFSISQSGTYVYYLRAYAGGCWGTASPGTTVTVDNPDTPWPVVTQSTNTCGYKTLTATPGDGPPPAGVTWHWQGRDPNGTNNNYDYTNPYYPDITGTYYIRALSSGGCWSPNSMAISVTVNSPSKPPAPMASTNSCGAKTLSFNGTPPTGYLWYWQTSPTGTQTISSSSTFNLTSSRTYTYYLRPYAGGCWGTASDGVTVSVDNPQTPWAVIRESTNICGPKTLTAAPEDGGPPAGITWNWQGLNSNGTAILDYTTPYSAATSGTYYIRARSSGGCWSSAQAYLVSTGDPATPNNPSTTALACGPQTLSKVGTPPAGVTWYWQGTNSNGTDYTSAAATAATYSAPATGTYFLRARNSSGCWSQLSSSAAPSVNPIPDAPATPTLSAGVCYERTLSKTGTPPGNVSWFWQGTNATGQDFTSATATAATYLVTANGTTTHYIRARSSAGCWSSSTSIAVPVENPSAPNANALAYCEWESMALTTTGVATTLNWYSSTDQFIVKSLAYTPTNLDLGTYTYKVKNLSSSNCESKTSATITLTVKSNCDDFVNWNESTLFTINASDGTPVAASSARAYSDGFGNVIQSQAKSLANNQVIATASVFDNLGKQALTTLPAPINSSTFAYRHRFITSSTNEKYSAAHFDANTTSAGGVTNPRPVGNNGQGSLGWYYSNSNTLEPLTPTSTFPYSRDWSEVHADPKTSKSAGPGNNYRMGLGREVVTVREKISSTELSHYYSIRTHFVAAPNRLTIPTEPGYKFISTDPDGKKTVTFIDFDGNALATALITATNTTTTPPTYTYDYWNYTFYNDIGNVVATVSPRGVDPASTTYPSFVTLYKYDHLGRVVELSSPDEGTTRYVYSFDGKIRFSQNQDQASSTPKRFSYTNYDKLGRLIESGEYVSNGTTPYVFEPHSTTTPATMSVLRIVDNVGHTGVSKKLDATRCTNVNYVDYDWQASDFPTDGLHASQTYLFGQVSRTQSDVSTTSSENPTTWYSYDEFGQLIWVKQNIPGLGVKTIDYTYDFLGNVVEVAYQKNIPGQPVNADAFYHHYVYDADQRLVEVLTSKNGTTKTSHAKYKYYLHGPLKRVELAGNKQGLDYVYAINGALKSINHGDPDKDPGLDGISGTYASFAKDVFGLTMHYHDNDYAGAAYSTGSVTLNATTYPNQYGGNLRAVTYHNRTEYEGLNGKNKKRVQAFQYDQINELLNAQFGSIAVNTAGTIYTPTFTEEQRENIGSYDKHGNINSLIRKGKSAQTTANYNYVYEANSNRLDKVNHNSALFIDYTYNSLGQMTQQVEGTKTYNMNYTPFGLSKEVKDGSNNLVLGYHYNDKGSAFKKVEYSNGSASKNTFYVEDPVGNVVAIYEQSPASGSIQLSEVPLYGATRVGLFKPGVSTYFYEVNDHLGNVRAVIGLPETDTYLATMESEKSEEPPFNNIANTRATYLNANHTPNSTGITGNEVARLNNAKPAGPAIILQVSPGDVINMNVWAYYEAGSSNFSPLITEATLINAIATAFGGVSGGAGESGQIFSRVQSGFPGTLGTTSSSTLPAAFLTYVVYDKNYTRRFWGSRGVTTAGNMSKEQLVQSPVTIDEPGFVYVCVYNRSDNTNPVYFDDLSVSVTHSPIVAGADYYPFGLVMDGREITDEPYRYGYQGQFSEEELVTGSTKFELRDYDSRIGKWLSVDPLGQFASPYVAMGNNPVMSVDPDGGWSLVGSAVGVVAGVGLSFAVGDEEHWYWYAAGGFVAGGILGEIAHTSNGTEVRGSNGWDRFTAIFGEGKKYGQGGASYVRYPINPKWKELAHSTITTVSQKPYQQWCVYACSEAVEKFLGGRRTKEDFSRNQNGGRLVDAGVNNNDLGRYYGRNFGRNLRGSGHNRANNAPGPNDVADQMKRGRVVSTVIDEGLMQGFNHNVMLKRVQRNIKKPAVYRYEVMDPAKGLRWISQKQYGRWYRVHFYIGR